MSAELPWVVEQSDRDRTQNPAAWFAVATFMGEDDACDFVRRNEHARYVYRVRDTRLDVPAAPVKPTAPTSATSAEQHFDALLAERRTKGRETYGKGLDHRDIFDWQQMALEEALDLAQYLAAENLRLRERVAALDAPTAPFACDPDVKPTPAHVSVVQVSNDGENWMNLPDEHVVGIYKYRRTKPPHDPERGCRGCEHFREETDEHFQRCMARDGFAAHGFRLVAKSTMPAPAWCPLRKPLPVAPDGGKFDHAPTANAVKAVMPTSTPRRMVYRDEYGEHVLLDAAAVRAIVRDMLDAYDRDAGLDARFRYAHDRINMIENHLIPKGFNPHRGEQ